MNVIEEIKSFPLKLSEVSIDNTKKYIKENKSKKAKAK